MATFLPTPDLIPGEDYIMNRDRTRAAVVVMCGYACYEGEVSDGEWDGLHRGVVESPEEAERWIRGDDDVRRVFLYGV